jgi:CubicO group peptidase (beta-lactamase class C family)/pimeloyl-ACP methyl ester carboxylesterase
MSKSAWLLSLTSFIALSAVAQQKQISTPDGKMLSSSAIDKIISKLMDTAEVTGLCLGIINGNKPVYVKSYGYKNKPLNKTNDTATCFYAASLAKPLFGYMVMQLVDKGIIDLDKPLYTYLPKPLPQYDNYKDLAGDDRWKLITGRQCLSHTTGFPNWRDFTPNKKLEIFFTPGKYFSYSGEGIELLQMVIEKITGRGLEDLAQENIFKPFGMRRTSFLWQPSFEKDYALGHDMSEDTITKNKRTQAHAAGSMETTIADYTRFMAAVMQGKRVNGKTKQEMLSPQIAIKYSNWAFPPVEKDSIPQQQAIQLSYGLGWGLFSTAYGKAFFKEGHIDGWEHYAISFPEQKIAFVIMTNSSNGESIFKELLEKLAAVNIPWQWEGYFPYKQTAKLSKQQLQKFTGIYDGKLKAIITLVNGKLKVESPTVNLPKTNIYPSNDHHLFLKIMDANFEFIKGANGKFEKIVASDEGENYELNKVENDKSIFDKSALDQKPINIAGWVNVGGIKQYISIKGSDSSKPLLLFLHGGPGASVMDQADKFTGKLQKEFVVVQWDQRQTGKTLQLNTSPVPLGLKLFQTDTHDLINALLLQFHKKKLYLVGHSWGTSLGFYIAGKYPELLYAYIAISPVINSNESEKIALDKLKQKAQQTNNATEIKELSTVKIPFENAEQLYYDRKWLFTFSGQEINDNTFPKSFVINWAATWFKVGMESFKKNIAQTLPSINCPVYFFVGRKDYQTNFSVTEKYYNKVKAPKKQLFWFENSGHGIPDTEPALMQDIIIGKIVADTR